MSVKKRFGCSSCVRDRRRVLRNRSVASVLNSLLGNQSRVSENLMMTNGESESNMLLVLLKIVTWKCSRVSNVPLLFILRKGRKRQPHSCRAKSIIHLKVFLLFFFSVWCFISGLMYTSLVSVIACSAFSLFLLLFPDLITALNLVFWWFLLETSKCLFAMSSKHRKIEFARNVLNRKSIPCLLLPLF